MAFILYCFADGHNEKIEVSEEFAAQYAEMEHRDALTERKETRRHQSLDKSVEHGFDVADPKANVLEEIEWRELSEEIHRALEVLTDKQRTVFELHVSEGLTFRAIGERLGLGTYTVRDYFYNAIKEVRRIRTTLTPFLFRRVVVSEKVCAVE